MDIDNLSSEEIEKLQARLAQRLDRKREEEQAAFVEKVMSMASEAGYDLAKIIEMLEGERKFDRAKYRHPDDATLTWSGMGRMPQWLHELVNKGNSKEDFKVS